MPKSKPMNSFQALSNAADRWAELIKLREMAKIIDEHPEWLEQEPRLKDLISKGGRQE